MRPTPTSSIRTATLCVSLWLVLAGSPQALAADAVLPPEKIASLFKRERPAVADPWGWATDMLAAFDEISQPATRENVCAGIAVISQESGFLANPAVPGLGRISEQSLRRKIGAYPLIGGTSSTISKPRLKPKAASWIASVPRRPSVISTSSIAR